MQVWRKQGKTFQPGSRHSRNDLAPEAFRERATEKQVQLLRRLGVPSTISYAFSKAEASAMIDSLMNNRLPKLTRKPLDPDYL